MSSESCGQIVWVAERHRGHSWEQGLSPGVGESDDAEGLAEVAAKWQALTCGRKVRWGGLVGRHLKGCLPQSSVQMSRLNVTCEGIQLRAVCLNLKVYVAYM